MESDSFTGPSSPAAVPLLSGALSAPASGLIKSDDLFRRYRAVLTSSTPMLGNVDTYQRGISYEVGRRFGDAASALAYTGATAMGGDCSVATNHIVAAEFTGLAKKHSNFSGVWTHMDLSGIVSRLGKALACESVYGGVSTEDMRGGRPLAVTVLSAVDTPVTATLSQVFLPRLVDGALAPSTFAVLAAAINGEGSTVVSDIIALDAADNRPIVPSCSGGELARGCVDALRILAANYTASDSGEVFAYALTRGIHSVVSVVGHTDEGGYMRRVLRAGGHRPPYGGIHYALEYGSGLPGLVSTSENAIAGWVDALALSTAALVAHCDPGTMVGGERYPTVFTTRIDSRAEGGAHQPGGREHALALGRRIASECSTFSENYCSALAKAFGLASGPTPAPAHLNACFGVAAGNDDRHLHHVSVAPWFWIEPTSLVPKDYLGSEAERAGFASLATQGVPATMPLFEEVEEVGALGGDSAAYVVRFRSARTCGLIGHLNGNPDNGLACVVPRQMDPEAIVHPGARAESAPDLASRVRAGEGLDTYLWVRGQSPIPAPSEFLNIGGKLGVVMHHANWDREFMDLTPEHLPAPREVPGGVVTWVVTRPVGIAPGKSNWESRQARRARVNAAMALESARTRARMYGASLADTMPVALGVPFFTREVVSAGRPAPAQARADRKPRPDDVEPTGLDKAERAEAGVGVTKPASAPGPEGREVKGVRPALPSVVMGTQTGPRVESGLPGARALGGGASKAEHRGQALASLSDPMSSGETSKPDEGAQ